MSKTDKELTSEIVIAYLGNHSYTYNNDEITNLIKDVHETLRALD